MNFAGGGVYIYLKYVDSRNQPVAASTYVKDHTHVKDQANGHCVQHSADSPAEPVNTVNMV